MQKKAALLIYPQFSCYEIGIVSALFKICQKGLTVFSASKQPVDSEEGFHFIPDYSIDSFRMGDYDCLILPGMWCFTDVLRDDRYIRFLEKFKENRDILIAGISSSPVLLAKAGLLEGKKYCAGLFEEDMDQYDFMNRDNRIKAPLVIDGNIITALGLAYREFAIEVGRKLNLACEDDWFSGIKKLKKSEDYSYFRNA